MEGLAPELARRLLRFPLSGAVDPDTCAKLRKRLDDEDGLLHDLDV